MPDYPFLQVDAFSDAPLRGNPCAIVLDAGEMDTATMQAVAREMNLSETSFVMESDRADFRVRYFTPAEEIPLAGHPTIATTFALIHAGRFAAGEGQSRLTLEMNVGPIPVDVVVEGGAIASITMSQKAPRFGEVYEAAEVMPVFGLTPEDVMAGGHPIQTVSTGTPQLMIPLSGPEALAAASLDVPAYRRLRAQADFFSPHLFCLQGHTPAGDTSARHFGVPPDMVEDPFTGSATGGMAAWLWRYGLIEAPRFVAEQGHLMGRPGTAQVEVVGPPEAMETVKVGGRAALVLEGELKL